jgi:hypothetical protein
LLKFERARDCQLDIIADRRHARCFSEMSVFDGASRLKNRGVGFIQRIDAGTREASLQRDGPGDAMQRQVAGDGGGAFADRRDLCGGEGRGREMRDVEPLVAS